MNKRIDYQKVFLKYLETEQVRSTSTLQNYRRYLDRYFRFTKTADPEDITLESITAYRDALEASTPPLSAATINGHLSALRSYLAFLHERGVVAISKQAVARVTTQSVVPTVLTAAELVRLQTSPKKQNVITARDQVLIELLLASGMKVSKLTALDCTDVEAIFEQYALSEQLQKQIKVYLSLRTDADSALFVQFGKNAKNAQSLRLSARAIQRTIARRAAAAGITKVVTPQVLRHTHVAQAMAAGASQQQLAAQLGFMDERTWRAYRKTFAAAAAGDEI